MKKFISLSGGVESTTMAILFGRGAKAIWVDTGSEHEEMYKRIDYVEERLLELHKGDFELIRLVADVVHKEKHFSSLEDLAVSYKFMPSGQKRYCTRLFKIAPIDMFLSSQGECELMIGFNADEEDRTGNLEKMENVNYTYPLIEDGLTRDDCEDILRLNSLHPSFPPYMLRGGCRMCFFKSEKEYKAMYYLNRKEFDEVMAFEESIQDKRNKFYSIMGTGKSLRQLSSQLKGEIDFDMNALYEDYKKDGKTCGAFCRR